uniref:Limbic system associated membrane protein n=1 Tax=Cavia porcellus TaxID=10141 RepID=H0VTV5_CAVPO
MLHMEMQGLMFALTLISFFCIPICNFWNGRVHLMPLNVGSNNEQSVAYFGILKISHTNFCFSGREVEGEEEYLEILGITREQSGKYECKAANEVSSADVKQVKVTVNYPPTITESKSNEATTGRQASLKCEASAVPAPDFEWYRDDTRINSANGLEIKSTEGQSSLTVTNVTEEHYGNYTCVAANKLGVTNASLVLFRPGSVRGINGSISLAVPLWLLAASLLCLLSKC